MGPVFIDFETRSPLDLKSSGLYLYARHPETDVWCMSHVFGDGPIRSWAVGENEDMADVLNHVRDGGEVVAHNAGFELAIWNQIMRPRHGWPELKPGQVTCTMAACYAMSLPGSLESAAAALGLDVRKDVAGRALMLKMCRPKPNGGWWDDPDMLRALRAYCNKDVAVERAIFNRVRPLSQKERGVWALSYTINQRGVPFEKASVAAAIKIVETQIGVYDREMARITNGRVATSTRIGKLKEWAADHGVVPGSLAKAELAELLEKELPARVREALEIRQKAGLASVAKLYSIVETGAPTGDALRVRNTIEYHAAGTGRFGGRGIQPHNFPRDLPEDPAEVEAIMRLVRAGRAGTIDLVYGPPIRVVSNCLRGFIHAERGNFLAGGDFSGVEMRGLAWLAGEEWKLRACREFDAGRGPDMYKLIYSHTFGTPVESVGRPQRQIGKVEDLAFGYQGGVGACQTLAKTYGVKVSDTDADAWKLAWRAEHPRIKQYWYDLEYASLEAVRNPGVRFSVGAPGRKVTFKKNGSFLWCQLPSARVLCYPYPEIQDGTYGDVLTYKSVPSQDDIKKRRIWGAIEELPFGPDGSRQWARVHTYGGKLAENVTQAICRDLLVEAMLGLESAGYTVVLHVHDEIVVEGRLEKSDRVKIEKIISVVPPWANGFPVAAKVWMNRRYQK